MESDTNARARSESIRRPSEGMRRPSEGRRRPSEGRRRPSEGMRRPSMGMRRSSSMKSGSDYRRQSINMMMHRKSLAESLRSRSDSMQRPSLASEMGQRQSDPWRRLSGMGGISLGGGTGRRQSILANIAEQRRLSKLGRPESDFLTEEVQPIPSEISEKQDKSKKPSKLPVFTGEFHKIMHKFSETPVFTFTILCVIMLNTGILIAQTSMAVTVRGGWYFSALDSVFLGVYLMEIVVKVYVWRGRFFKEGWNVLDFTIVVMNLVDFTLPLVLQNVGGFNGAAIFRLLRIFRAVRAIRALRVLRTIRLLANLQVIMTTLLQSVKSIGAIVILITLFMYMFAVVGRGLYADVAPEYFGNVFKAFFTLFQLLTLDDWFEIYNNVCLRDPGRCHVLFYLLLYIVVEYFIFLNLFVAVLVDNFQLTLEAQNEATKKKKKLLEEAEDADDNFVSFISEDSSFASDLSEERPVRKTIQDHYPRMKPEESETLQKYLSLLTSLEYNCYLYNTQQRTLDMMVDMCSDTIVDV